MCPTQVHEGRYDDLYVHKRGYDRFGERNLSGQIYAHALGSPHSGSALDIDYSVYTLVISDPSGARFIRIDTHANFSHRQPNTSSGALGVGWAHRQGF